MQKKITQCISRLVEGLGFLRVVPPRRRPVVRRGVARHFERVGRRVARAAGGFRRV